MRKLWSFFNESHSEDRIKDNSLKYLEKLQSIVTQICTLTSKPSLFFLQLKAIFQNIPFI